MNIVETVALAKKGDAEAFAQLVTSKQADFYRIAYSYTKNKDDALDVVSEAVYKAFISLKKLRQPEHFYTWMTRIMINSALSYTRKKQRMVFSEPELADDPGNSVSHEELLDLHSAIAKLPEQQKTVIILKYLCDLTITEVARVMDCPVGTAKTHLHKALKELRLELKEDFDE